MPEIALFHQYVGGESPDTQIPIKACIELLNCGQAYRAWRLLDRIEKLNLSNSVDLKLLQAKALQLCGRPEMAIEVLEQALAMFPESHPALSNFLLRLYNETACNSPRSATQYAWQILGKQCSAEDLMLAIRILQKNQVTPIGKCEFSGDTITGWLLNAEKQSPLTVTIDGNDFSLKPFLPTPLLQAQGLGGCQDGFAMKVPPNRFRCIRIHIDGRDLAGSPIHLPVEAELPDPDDATHPLMESDETVDIIVPVYKGYAETKACLESVLAAKNNSAYRLLVIDDASPDSELSAYLQNLAADARITLLKQPLNMGFVKAVVRGIQAGVNRDVVLLNADTCVQGNWLDRLRDAAYLDNRIGTVTPLSNNGELVSYPMPMQSFEMPNPELLKKLDDLCASLGSESVVDIPVGVGFCLYIKRQCLNDAGGFDSGIIERGYCEDTDFCIRASQRGWRNLCAPNVFVAHAGSVSFGAEKARLVAKNVAKLHALYPCHEDEYDRFLASDPLRDARAFLQRNLLPYFAGVEAELAVLLPQRRSDYGRQRLEIRLRNSGRHLFYLMPDQDDRGQPLVKLQHRDPLQPISLSYAWPDDSRQLWLDLNSVGFKYIDIYDFGDWPWGIIRGLADLNIPYRLYLNDCAAYCPRPNLNRPNVGYCGEPQEIEHCRDCVEEYGSGIKGIKDLEQFRKEAALMLANAESIVLSNQQIMAKYQAHFPGVSFQLPLESLPKADGQLHDEQDALSRDGVMRIAVLQGATLDDNFLALLEMARLMAAQQVNAELLVLGESWDDQALIATGKAWVTGPLAYDDLPRYIALHHCSSVFHAPGTLRADDTAWLLARQCGIPLAAPASDVFASLLDEALGDIVLSPEQTLSDWLSVMLKMQVAD